MQAPATTVNQLLDAINRGLISLAGESSDVLRRQQDGRWLIALDNPWGAQLLPR